LSSVSFENGHEFPAPCHKRAILTPSLSP
jgi:hypothetical protein